MCLCMLIERGRGGVGVVEMRGGGRDKLVLLCDEVVTRTGGESGCRF